MVVDWTPLDGILDAIGQALGLKGANSVGLAGELSLQSYRVFVIKVIPVLVDN